jgi:hypothetical protein
MATNGRALVWVVPASATLKRRTLTLFPLVLAAGPGFYFLPLVFYSLAGVAVVSALLYAVFGWRTGTMSGGASERTKVRELISQGHVVPAVNGLVSWPHGQGHARRLFHELEQEWAGSGLGVVISTTQPELAQRYEKYGFTPVQGSSPSALFRCF